MEEPGASNPSPSGEDQTVSTTVVVTGGGSAKDKAAQCLVVSVYQTKISGTPRGVTVTWSKNIINHSLSVSVEKSSTDSAHFTCKVDLKPWPFWSKKGFKSFEVDASRVDLFWDLRSAKFSGGPEPSGGYYVALVCNEEVILLLGDCKKEAYKRTKSRPSLEDAVLISKRENVFGKKCFSTRAKFDERRKEHDIVVENSISGPRDPEMWISIDGIVLIHVNNLQWKFRGNETVLVERVPVEVFWDVHDWLFGGPGLGHALFIFKPGAPPRTAAWEDEKNNGGSYEQSNSSPTEIGESSAPVARNGGGVLPDFAFFLYAWKME